MSEVGVMLHSYRSRGLLPAVVCAFVSILLNHPAAAQTSAAGPGPLSPFSLRLTSNVTWDTNVFRLPESAPDPQAAVGIGGKSDYFTTSTIGLLFDKAYSQQRFVANVNQSAIRYHKFTSLDRDAFDYRAAWLWQLTPRVSGTLSTDRQESAVLFEDITVGRRLIKTVTELQRFTIDGLLFGGWHLLAGASRSDTKNGQIFLAVPGTTLTNNEVGLRYIASSGSSITATQRFGRGSYPGQEIDLANLLDTGFKVQETEVAATWIASAKSALSGRLTQTERRYDHLSQLDFSGVGGELRFGWTSSARLLINASLARALTPYFQAPTIATPGSTHRADNTFTLAPVWQVSEKVSLNMNAVRVSTDYPAFGNLFAGPPRRDITRRLSLGANWLVHPKVNLSATLQREERSSNLPGLDFNDSIVGIAANLTY